MLLQKNAINQLRDFGLNTYESKLWTALLARGVATAGELSDITTVPRSRTYDILESLEKKGFIIMKLGKPIKYLTIDPESVLDRVKKKITENADMQTGIIKKLADSELLSELRLLHKTGIKKIDPTDFSGIFKGRKNVQHHVDKKIKSAKKQVLVHTTETGLIHERESMMNAFRKAKNNGARVLIAAPITDQNAKAAMDLGKHAEVRAAGSQGRFYVVDGEEIIFMLTNDTDVHQTYDSAVWVKSKFFAGSMKRLFMGSWTGMKKVQKGQ